MANFNKLRNAEAERVAILLEELGEAQQVVEKILSHGYESSNPLDTTSLANLTNLERELGDIQCILGMMKAAGDISADAIERFRYEKAGRIKKWLHHQEPTQ